MRKVISLCVLLACTILQAIAQSGAIKITVTDENAYPVNNAIVHVINKQTYAEGKTGSDGTATINKLIAGNYTISVNKAGFVTGKITAIVQPKQTTAVNMQLTTIINSLQETTVKSKEGKNKTIQSHATPSPVLKAQMGDASPKRGEAVSSRAFDFDCRFAASAPAYYNPSRESYKKYPENDFMTVRANPLSTMSIDVDRASYSNVRRFLKHGTMPPADAVRVEEMINYFEYQYPQPAADKPLAIVTELTDCPWESQHKLLHIGMQAKNISTENLPPSNLVFLIDVSGSMNEENKLPLVKASLKMLTRKLRSKDKISIVVYAGSAGLVLPATYGSNKQTIYNALDKLQAGGSTAGGAGIKLAYKVAMDNYIQGGNNRVILATDGDFNVGVSGDNELEEMIIKERQKGIYLTCLGYGMGNYKDSKMEVLADKGNGNYAYIDDEREARKTLVREFGGTIFTLAKDVKTQIEFNPQFVQSYRLVGYENRLLNEEDFKDDKKDAGDMGSGHSVTIIYEIIPAGITSDKVRNVTPLKYQDRNTLPDVREILSNSNELATIKFRYKKPNGNTSKEMVHIIPNETHRLQNTDDNVRFATSVAMFGMLLKHSQYKGSSSYTKVLALANSSNNEDENRAEYVQLVKIAKKIHDNDKVDEELIGWYEEE